MHCVHNKQKFITINILKNEAINSNCMYGIYTLQYSTVISDELRISRKISRSRIFPSSDDDSKSQKRYCHE
uniref:Bm13100 n=1 Tax=Brugia malayi TaxID=6279 RepID=A0A1I9G2B4_BRUMA|nr:Bm13100 [Brugia malayi]